MKSSKLTLSFSNINDLNKFGKVVDSSEFVNTILDETITAVQSKETGVVDSEKVTYSMITVYSLTGINHIVYKRITEAGTEVRKLYIGD